MKKLIRSNVRIEVYPKVYGNYTKDKDISFNTSKNICKNIIDDIERHVDNIFSMKIVWDNNSVCSYCGNDWEQEWDNEEPMCCQKAIDEYHNNIGNSNEQK